MTRSSPPISRRHALQLSLACAGLGLSSCSAKTAETKFKMDVAQANQSLAALKPLFTEKKPPQPGDWLESQPEKGQSFAKFLKVRPRRAIEDYARLYLQPLGEFTAAEQKVLTATADCLGHFFGLPVVTSPAVSLDDLPTKARRINPKWKMPQVLSTYLLDQVLKPRRAEDAAAVLGLTASDLWPGEDWNFVFGQASLSERVGVWSTYRNGDPQGDAAERQRYLLRTLKTAMHETGHMFGIQHCTAFECGMNGSNSLTEADRQPLEFCHECQAKIWYSCDVEPKARCAALLKFAEEHELKDEAAFWTKSLAALGK